MTIAKYKQKPLDNLYKKGKSKLQPSSTTNPAQNAAAGTTWHAILTGLPTASVVNMWSDEAQELSMNMKPQVKNNSLFQSMPQDTSLPMSSYTWNLLTSLSQMQDEQTSFGQTTINNSSSHTTEQTGPLDVSKPVTLTVKGQLKPNILTKVPRQKSSPSLKAPKKISNIV